MKTIIYYPDLTTFTGSITSSLLLSALIDIKHERGNLFCCTNDELIDRLQVGISEFKTAKKRLKELGVIVTTKEGIPAKTFYRIILNNYNFIEILNNNYIRI